MTTKNLILVLFFLTLFSGNTFAQSEAFDFKNFILVDGKREVNFKIIGISDNKQLEKLVYRLKNDPQIFSIKKFNYQFQLGLSNDIDALYIYKILQSEGVDFDPQSIIGKIPNSPENSEFSETILTPNGQLVSFKLIGLRSSKHLIEIIEKFRNDNKIILCNTFKDKDNNDLLQLEIPITTNYAYVSKTLTQLGVSIDPAFLLKEGQEVKKSRLDKMPEHYPFYITTGNSEVDNTKYEKEKKIWLKNYPKEVQILMGKNYYDIVSNESFYLDEPPSFIDTGNKELDTMKFEKRKSEWNKTHSLKN